LNLTLVIRQPNEYGVSTPHDYTLRDIC
jgi:hypothetical protein